MGTAVNLLDGSPVASLVAEFRDSDADMASARFGLRCQYTLGLIKLFIDECEHATFTKAIRFELLKAHAGEVATIDMGVGCDADWDKAWSSLLTVVDPGRSY